LSDILRSAAGRHTHQNEDAKQCFHREPHIRLRHRIST